MGRKGENAMVNIEKDPITSIILSAELMMYGYLSVRVSQEDDKVIASWYAMADGGQVIADGQKEYRDLDFSQFKDSICRLAFPAEEDEALSVVWGVQFGDANDELLYELSSGLWNPDLLEQIINEIESFLKDNEPLAQFKDLLQWA